MYKKDGSRLRALGSKGSLADNIYVAVMLLVGAFIIFLVYYFVSAIETPLANAGMDVSYIADTKAALEVYNTGFVFIILGAGVTSMIGSFFINSHPIFFVFAFFFNGFTVFFCSIVTNVYYQFAQMSIFSDVVTTFNVLNQVMLNLPLIMLAISTVVSIALYAKERVI